jgi:hypothetical protein
VRDWKAGSCYIALGAQVTIKAFYAQFKGKNAAQFNTE